MCLRLFAFLTQFAVFLTLACAFPAESAVASAQAAVAAPGTQWLQPSVAHGSNFEAHALALHDAAPAAQVELPADAHAVLLVHTAAPGISGAMARPADPAAAARLSPTLAGPQRPPRTALRRT